MTNAEVARAMERIRQAREARARDQETNARTPVSSVHWTRVAHAAGTRVFDPLTGEEGEVISRGSENVVVPTPQR